MPSSNAVRYDIAIYVEPEYVERFEAVINKGNDDDLLLGFEKLAGEYMDCERRGVRPGVLNNPIFATADYGEGVIEIYPGDKS